ncbi:DUF2721 domain-containing protein, partial [bacterium BMS3Abin03]|nr:DUF2721 domain-containing protein [bacterium BMS3Abin03]
VLNKYESSDDSISDNVRLGSITKQLDKLVFRVKLVKNAVLSYTIAVALFVFTSILIGLKHVLFADSSGYIVMIIFLCGMILVLVGAFFAAYETIRGFEIINLEVEVDN